MWKSGHGGVHLSSEGNAEPFVVTGSCFSFCGDEVYNACTIGDQIFVLNDLL